MLLKTICQRRYFKCLNLKRSINLTLIRNVQTVSLSHTVYDPPGNTIENPFLITHGLLGSKNNWNSIAKAVAKVTNRKVITFDARNHGDSPQTVDHSYDLMAEDILTFAKALKINKFSLMGHSMGGRTVMAFALRYPEFIDKLVVVDVSPISITSAFGEMKGFLEVMLNTKFDIGRKIGLAEARKIANESLMSVSQDPSIRAFLITNLADSDGKIYWKPNLPVLLNSLNEVTTFPTELLSRPFNQPTLFIRGEKSRYVPIEDIPKLKQLFSNCKVDTIKDAGHWPHAEKVNDFLASLVPFLKQ